MQDKKNMVAHIKDHQKYPANKEQMVAECDNLADFSDEDKKWFAEKLEDKTYNSADEVIESLGL